MERYEHDDCPLCGTASEPAEQVPDQMFRFCPNCGEEWFEDGPEVRFGSWADRFHYSYGGEA